MESKPKKYYGVMYIETSGSQKKKTGKLEPADSAKMAGDLSVGHLSVELGDWKQKEWLRARNGFLLEKAIKWQPRALW